MLDVFYTVDVEIWCEGWIDLDRKFPSAFRRYVYGSTSRGDYGLPYQMDVLNAHGLTGVFFVEPLFSRRFGSAPLDEIVGLLRSGKQHVELHLHTEWVDESREPLLAASGVKRRYLSHFSFEEQRTLIALARMLVAKAGASDISAFRAGNFAFNRNTLRALAENRIEFDSSYNASQFGLDSEVMTGTVVVEPVECDGVREYPMTVFDDGSGSLRHAQLTACSYREMEGLLWKALDAGRSSFVILSHGFELLNRAMDRPDDVVVERFRRLCSFLDRNRNSFRVRGFRGLEPPATRTQPSPLRSPRWKASARMLEQVYRRRYG